MDKGYMKMPKILNATVTLKCMSRWAKEADMVKSV